MKSKFKKGQKVRCDQYQDKPTCVITDIREGSYDANRLEIWVREVPNKTGTTDWWGPEIWFTAIKKKAIRKPKAPTGLAYEGSLCDNGIPGCTCNQSASVSQ